MTAVAEPEDTEEGQTQEPTTIEGDVPKPTFEIKPEEPSEGAAAPKKSKAERRAERGEGFAQEAARLRAENERHVADNRRLAEQIANIQGQLQAGRQNEPDPNQARLNAIATKIEQTVARMGKGDADAVNEWHDLRREEARIIARMEAAGTAREIQANQPRPLDPVLAHVAAKHDWITTDTEARQYAEGIVAKLVRMERRDMNNPQIRRATLLEAAAIAERDLGINGAATAPTEAQQQRYTGTSGANAGAGTGRGQVVALNDVQKGLATAMFRNLEPEAAYREWWKQIGAKIPNSPNK